MSTLAARLALPLRRPLTAISLAALSLPPRLQRQLVIGWVAFVLLSTLYLLWFRDSGMVQVEKVRISGLTASDTRSLRRALATAARGMTTLHLDRGRLERVAAMSPVVERLELSTDFPHTLRIHVIERRAAAMAVSGHSRVPVAADGSLLRGLPVPGALPVVKLPAPPDGDRLTDHAALVAVHVTGTAPPELLPRLRGVKRQARRGLVVSMRRGPDLILGDTTRLQAKWAALARVLADPASRGATYIDVRLPDRPAAGGLTTDTVDSTPEPASPPAGQSSPPGAAGAASPPAQSTPGAGAGAPQQTAPAPQQAPQGPAPATPTGPLANPQP